MDNCIHESHTYTICTYIRMPAHMPGGRLEATMHLALDLHMHFHTSIDFQKQIQEARLAHLCLGQASKAGQQKS